MDRRRGLIALLIVALDNYHRTRYLVQVYLDRFLLLILRLRPPHRTLITTPATRLGLATVQDLLQAYQVILPYSLYFFTSKIKSVIFEGMVFNFNFSFVLC